MSLFAGSALKVVDERLLGRDLLGLAAAAEADEPADDLAAVGAEAAGDRLGRDGDEGRGGAGGGGRGGRGGGARARTMWLEPPQAAATMATTPSEGDQGRAGRIENGSSR